jgi:hypothetical protein
MSTFNCALLKSGGAILDLSNRMYLEPTVFSKASDPVCEERNKTNNARSVREAAVSWNMDLGRNILERVTVK